MAGLYPLSRMQQFDGNGRPLSGARLFLFDGGTEPRIGYRDSSLTAPHPNPISAGRLPLIYLDDGFYHHRLIRSHQPEGDAADLIIDRIYHLLTLRFALWRARERAVHPDEMGWLIPG